MDVLIGEGEEGEEEFVEFVGVACGGLCFVADALDGVVVEASEVALFGGEGASGHDGAGASFFEWCVVEEAEGVDVDDALGHG